MSAYELSRAVFDLLRAGTASSPGAGADPEPPGLTEDERAALCDRDLRRLAQLGVHPVLINALARAIGTTRDEYRVLLAGTGDPRSGRARWRSS